MMFHKLYQNLYFKL